MKNYATSPTYGLTLTHERLVEVLHYDRHTGSFTWSQDGRGRFKRAGAAAGRINPTWGRRCIGIDGREYLAARLAWLYVHGRWPEHEIDHINGDRLDDRIENLRDVTRTVNQQNIRRARAGTRSGVLGVFQNTSGIISSAVQVAGRSHYLGSFETAEQAHAAYVSAKRELHEGCTL
jgi:hypothetical protein